MSKKKTTREKLINAIIEYANDEFEEVNDVFQLAKESEDELVDRLIWILGYYHNELNQ